MDDATPEPDYELVMPDVVTTETGGPYDSASYGAGLIAGWAIGDLERGDRDDRNHYATRPLLPQLDLIAMHHGYRMQLADDTANPDRVWVRFVRVTPVAVSTAEERAADLIRRHRTWISDGGPEETYWTCECGWACSPEEWESDLGVGHVPAKHVADRLRVADVLRPPADGPEE